jgi:hypothetical protein
MCCQAAPSPKTGSVFLFPHIGAEIFKVHFLIGSLTCDFQPQGFFMNQCPPKIRGDIRELVFITGVNDTSDKLFSGVNDNSEKFVKILSQNFSFFSLVSFTPLINIHLRISPRIFEKI